MPVQRCVKDGKLGWRWGKSGKCYTGRGAKAKAEKQGVAIKASGYQEHNGANIGRNKMVLQKITTNFTGVTRNDTMEGKDYLVAPMIMIVEGVHEGSNGPLYYPAEELSKTPAVWNTKPIVVYHPQANGKGISACDPDILTNRKVGIIMNTTFEDGKLKAEAWLDIDRINKVDKRIADAVENNEMMELSTGLFTDNEGVEGEWNGEHYIAIARNYRPDHLALLPDLVGACSIEDGAGFLRLNEVKSGLTLEVNEVTEKARKYILNNNKRFTGKFLRYLNSVVSNEISFDDTRRRLQSIVNEKFEDDDYVYIEEVFDDYFVYERGGKLYRQNYDDVNGSLVLKGIPVVVVKDTNYIPVKLERLKQMEKEKVVDALIANKSTKWTEDDKEALMEFDEDVLDKFIPVENEEDDKDGEGGKTAVQEIVEKGTEETVVPSKEEKEEKEEVVENMSAEDYISKKVPDELKDVFRSGLASHNATKNRLIDVIVSNEKNTFTKEQLASKKLDELKSIASLAVNTDERENGIETLNYGGQGDPICGDVTEKPLDLPTLNFTG